MIGVPVRIQRDGQDEEVFLSTRRSGNKGQALAKAKRDWRRAGLRSGKLTTKMGVLIQKIEDAATDEENAGERLEALGERVDSLSEELLDAREAEKDAAAELVERALRDNHGPETDGIMDCLTDRDIQTMCSIMESGDVPEDFFPGRATRRSENSTGQDGAMPGGASSATGTIAKTSNPGA